MSLLGERERAGSVSKLSFRTSGQDPREAELCANLAGLKLKSFFPVPNRFADPPLFHQSDSQVVMRFNVFGIEGERFFPMGNRLIQLAFLEKGNGEIVMGLGVVRL